MELALPSDDREVIGMTSWIDVRYALRSEIPGIKRFAAIIAIRGWIERKLMYTDALSDAE
ncbi:MAG: hypothetical protein KKH67_04965 [candidate division Zixibacteria bacterium]|nr:hypothetical protein [candidate division Zixibacteria bacterium]MBU1469607.1 hypothetical protein [candidate division Zixibacteria bacterium]